MLKGTYLQRVQPTWRTTGIFNIKKDRFSFSSRFAYNHQFININNQVKSNFPEERWLVNNPLQIETEGYVATADIGYQISDNWEIGGQYYYNGTFVKIDVDQFTEVTDRDSGEKIRNIRSQGDEPQYPKRHLVNFYNKVELDSSGKKLILNLDFFKDSNPYNAKNYEGVSIDQESEVTQFFKSSNRYSREVTNYSATLDVEYPLEWILVENSLIYNLITIFLFLTVALLMNLFLILSLKKLNLTIEKISIRYIYRQVETLVTTGLRNLV